MVSASGVSPGVSSHGCADARFDADPQDGTGRAGSRHAMAKER